MIIFKNVAQKNRVRSFRSCIEVMYKLFVNDENDLRGFIKLLHIIHLDYSIVVVSIVLTSFQTVNQMHYNVSEVPKLDYYFIIIIFYIPSVSIFPREVLKKLVKMKRLGMSIIIMKMAPDEIRQLALAFQTRNFFW